MKIRSKWSIDDCATVLGLEPEQAFLVLKKYGVKPTESGLYSGQAVTELKELLRRKRDGTCI